MMYATHLNTQKPSEFPQNPEYLSDLIRPKKKGNFWVDNLLGGIILYHSKVQNEKKPQHIMK